MKLGGPQTRRGSGGEKKKIPPLFCWEVNPSRPDHMLLSMLTATSIVSDRNYACEVKVITEPHWKMSLNV